MSNKRQRKLTPADERFLIVRTLVAQCAPGLKTTTPTAGWHRLITSAEGVILVRTPHGDWSAPTRHAVWVPSGVRAELETCAPTALQILYIRVSKAAWSRGPHPTACKPVAASALLREIVTRVVALSALDRRVPWHVGLAQMLLHEVQAGAEEPIALVWPRDSRAARVAARVQADPAGAGSLQELCRGQAASARTVQRIFPLETGLTFEAWRARLRFLHASRLLAEGHKVSEVAALCGYRSASGFVVAFRRMGGCTPGRLCATGRADPSAQG